MINSAKFHLLGVCLGMSLFFKFNLEVSTKVPFLFWIFLSADRGMLSQQLSTTRND